jgi:RHS repeat-associated protein
VPTLKTSWIAVLLASLLALSASAEPPKPPPGFAKYVMVLKAPEALPPGQAKPNPGKKIVEPDVVKLGGQVVQSRDNERVIFLPPGKAKQLRSDENVAYLQRVWLGEPLSEIEAADEPATGPRLTTNAETDLSWDSGAYEYDGSGNIKQIGSDTYRYDAAGRVTTALVNTTTVTYNYDSFGNLTSTQVGSQPAAITPVDRTSNRLSQAEYDAAGNVTTNGRYTRYYYDALNMMSGVDTEIGQQKRMIYTADDERIGVYVDSLSHWTFRGLDGKVLTHFHGDDYTWVWDQDFVYANGQLVGGAREEAFGGRRHYHLDHLGSVRLISDQSRMSIGRHDYYPFGVEQTSMSQEDTNWGYIRPDPMKFAGHQRDFLGAWNTDNTDYLDYMHARYYNPNHGRFLSVDPVRGAIREPQTWNRYAYATNNPVNSVDPDGRCSFILTDGSPYQDSNVVCTEVVAHWSGDDTRQSADRSDAMARTSFLGSLGKLRNFYEHPSAVTVRSAMDDPRVMQFADVADEAAGPIEFGLAIQSLAIGGGDIPVPLDDVVIVSRWGRPGLEAGDWVMQGSSSKWNYFWSGKWQPGFGNQFAKFASGEEYRVLRSALRWPKGWGVDGWVKGLLGQRMFLP